MIKKGDEIEVRVTDLSSEGKGIAKHEEGFVIFITGSLPGDRSLVRIQKKKSNYAEAKTLKIISVSEDRVDALCKHFYVCGGCKTQDLKYEKQLEYKAKAVKDAFERIGGFRDTLIPPVIPSPEIFFYRNKMEFTFSDNKWWESPPTPLQKVGSDKEGVEGNDPKAPLDKGGLGRLKEHESNDPKAPLDKGGLGGLNLDLESNNPKASRELWELNNFALGLHVPGFHSKIVDVEECFLQSELTADILNFTRRFFKERNVSVYSTKTHSGFLRFLIIREGKNTSDILVNLITHTFDEKLMNEFGKNLNENFPQITTFINGISSKKAQVAFSEEEHIIFGTGFITEKLTTVDSQSFIFKISANSFFQTNTMQAENLFKIAAEFGDYSKQDNVLDLYCGAGAISLFISKKVNKVLGVELIEDAISNAKENAEINNVKNVEFIISDIKDFLACNDLYKSFNKIILDPPRSGLHPKICELISVTKFDNIVYISCNAQTQARDLKIICSRGNYKIDKIQPVDMFPHTFHVENVVKLIPMQF
jgi:23S rRNA (uracil1939-C5)-methyltransferase